jgi:hypothetical protein
MCTSDVDELANTLRSLPGLPNVEHLIFDTLSLCPKSFSKCWSNEPPYPLKLTSIHIRVFDYQSITQFLDWLSLHPNLSSIQVGIEAYDDGKDVVDGILRKLGPCLFHLKLFIETESESPMECTSDTGLHPFIFVMTLK